MNMNELHCAKYRLLPISSRQETVGLYLLASLSFQLPVYYNSMPKAQPGRKRASTEDRTRDLLMFSTTNEVL